MRHFVFDGSSRMRNMTLARDHYKNRNRIIEDAERVRLRREQEARRKLAAQRLQRVIRQWRACQTTVRLALSDLDSLSSDMSQIVLPPSCAGASSAVLTPGAPSQSKQLTARLRTACWCLSYVRSHKGQIPLHRNMSSEAATTVGGCPEVCAVEGDAPESKAAGGGGGATASSRVTLPSTYTSPVASLRELREYQRGVLWRYSECVYVALSQSTNHSAQSDERAGDDSTAVHDSGHTEAVAPNRPINSLSLLESSLLASLPVEDLALLLCVLLQQFSSAAPSRHEGCSSTLSSASSVEQVGRLIVDALLAHNTAFACTLNEEPSPHGGYGDLKMAVAAFDRWPVVHALTSALTFLGEEMMSQPTSVRSHCVQLLQPLAAAFPSLPPLEVGGCYPLPPPPTCAFARACWTCMCAPFASEDYQRLTSNSLAVVLCAADTTAEGAGRGACDVADSFLMMLLAECHRRIAEDIEITPGDDVSGLRGGRLRARVLGRLIRLLPCVHQLVETMSSPAAVSPPLVAPRTDLVKWYLLSLSCLSERLCRENFFIEGLLADHYAYNTGRQKNWCSVGTEDGDGDLSASPRGQYRLLTSYLFSEEGGLRLLQLLIAQDERHEKLRLQASQKLTVEAPDDIAAALANKCSGNEEETSTGASSTGCATHFSPAAAAAPQWPSSASMQQSPLEILCNVFAWPIFAFSKTIYHDYQRETLALYTKMVRTPQLLRRLWGLYWKSCEGLRAVLPPGEALQRLCQPQVFSAQGIGEKHLAGDDEWGPGRHVASTAASMSLPRLPRWEMHPQYPLAFYDPHASLSTLFFTLLAYYVNVCNFTDELRRGGEGAVLSTEESWALVLALKEIVHRSHMYGVVPGTNSEAVAHAACLLLSRLHRVDEADPFVPAAVTNLWLSIGSVASEAAVTSLFHTWDSLSAAVVDEDNNEEDWTRGFDDASASTSTRGVRASIGAPTETAAAPAFIAPARLPGDVLAFHESMQWKQPTRYTKLLVHAPFMVPFAARAMLLSALLAETDSRWTLPSEQRTVVHRGRTFIDAFDLFHDNPLSSDMLGVRFVAEDGTLEAGYGRGVYREFIVSLCKEGFATECGLFRQTPDGHVYPNSFSALATNDAQHLLKIRFLGAMVGRALRDGVLQDFPFALHFRNAILGRRNTLSNLKSFDPELYHQLMSLTRLSEEELLAVGLTFVYTLSALGTTKEVELVSGGAKMEVTPRNCLFYVNLVADLKLNREAADQTNAFCSGLHSVIDENRLRLFDSNEVGQLFGGDETGQIDLEDWKENTVYNQPEDKDTPPVRLFWDVVESLSREQQRQLLKFVTSMTRPPLLGFRFLAPPFKVQLLTLNASGPDHLPSAATCFSTLKLPPYKDFATARAKIIAAIEESVTFEFS
ncbi:hypothetical protein JKF63_02889 [Porcisia hertigi]|uniref:HECT-type E3 ubiquitin transferase n=1 Tax=Porcisia hertigi TaxID=2761500 RepID=A0A836IDY8_9TRYP|nr:hypothetical protein JKF63_02889 [Porcisia hertigi]